MQSSYPKVLSFHQTWRVLMLYRLIKSSRVIGNHIAYYNKDITNVFLVFQERWSLHKRGAKRLLISPPPWTWPSTLVYTHPAAKAIEYMVVDALIAADPYLRISEQVDDPKRYVFLTDAILEEIERSEQPVGSTPVSTLYPHPNSGAWCCERTRNATSAETIVQMCRYRSSPGAPRGTLENFHHVRKNFVRSKQSS